MPTFTNYSGVYKKFNNRGNSGGGSAFPRNFNKVVDTVKKHSAGNDFGWMPEEKKKLMADGSWNAMSPAAQDAFNRKWAGAPAAPAATASGQNTGDSWADSYLSGGGSGGGRGGSSAEEERAAAERAREQALQVINNTRNQYQMGAQKAEENLLAMRDQALQGFENAYNRKIGLLKDRYGDSRGIVENDRKKALADAYASKMAQERNAAQVMSLTGATGGLSESTLANMSNEYGKNRTALSDMYGRKLADLAAAQATEEAAALQMLDDQKREEERYYQQKKQQQADRYQSLLDNLMEKELSLRAY